MAYAEEANLDTDPWTRDEFTTYEYSFKDEKIANDIFFHRYKSEDELESDLHRLAQVAAVTGSVAARANLAQYGGIGVHEAELFRSVVNPDLEKIDLEAEYEILRRARAKKRAGDYNSYLALSAVIGYYPPEYGDRKPCPDSPTADPFYDQRGHIMRAPVANLHLLGNSG